MYQRILVPLDGSSVAAQALPIARTLAAGLHGTLVLLRVFDSVRDATRGGGAEARADEQAADLRQLALEVFAPVREELAAEGIAFECAVGFGRPAQKIMEFAGREHIALIVMATHARAGLTRMVYGSVTDAIVRQGRQPLLVVRASATPLAVPARIHRILVPLDGSSLAEAAIPHARDLAGALEAEVLLFSIWDTFGYELTMYPRDEVEAEMHEKHGIAKQYLISKVDELRAAGVRARWQLQSGLVVESIANAAEKQAANLIVMSTHGRRGLNRWVEGSVADEVLRATQIPVILIREPESADEPARQVRTEPGSR